MSPGIAALAFIPSKSQLRIHVYLSRLNRLVKVSMGACLDIFIVVAWDRYLLRAKIRGDAWAFSEEYRRIPLACLGGPLCALALFWLVSPPQLSNVQDGHNRMADNGTYRAGRLIPTVTGLCLCLLASHMAW